MLSRLRKSALLRDIIKLVSGTAGARVILLITLPIVTRLYSPDDFKLLAVFAALVSITSVIACLRMEVAVPFAEHDDDAANILTNALTLGVIFSLVLMLIAITAPMSIADRINTPEIAPYLWLVPVTVIFAATYNAMQSWMTRKRRFGNIARTRISQAIIGTGTTLWLGWFAFTPLGLLVGNALTLGGGALYLSLKAWRDDHAHFQVINPRRMREMFIHNMRYPIFSTPEALANVAAVQFPIIIIAATSGTEAGQLFLAMQILTTPMTLIGTSVGQVYSSRAAEELRSGNLHPFTKNIMKNLFLVGLLPLSLVTILAPFVFPLIFGAEWLSAGKMTAWIAPWMLFQLTASPVSLVMGLLGRQHQMLLLTLFGALLRIGVTLISLLTQPEWVVEAYAVSGCIFYITCAVVFYNVTKQTLVRQ